NLKCVAAPRAARRLPEACLDCAFCRQNKMAGREGDRNDAPNGSSRRARVTGLLVCTVTTVTLVARRPGSRRPGTNPASHKSAPINRRKQKKWLLSQPNM